MVGFCSACSILSDLDHGTCVHGQIIKNGCEDDVAVKNALIGLYCKCGNISSADILFNRTKFMKDMVSWNVIISGYMEGGYDKEAISSFHQMKLENFHPTLVTFASILPAVAHLAALKRGHGFSSALSDIHAHSSRWGDSGKTRSMMSDTGLKRTPGCSWVEVENRVQPFRVGDYNYPAPT
ncbi:pentatricopeptide repeat-containing protein [Pyrus ussuriensis x Pyrus communis]|uniref:Pentatricopeptide repeat-containing protein n=1 Tax=Pyrus ussuriensis x Pyrus communis TaxID=2448454 RepID=A0A5N5FAF6_9ROSA|nr:pentatricopeptide repeat-containing protein [Pyrus ussuriensis x Pyrus communis]